MTVARTRKEKLKNQRWANVSFRRAKTLEDDPAGFARSTVSAVTKAEGREAYETLHSRDLEPEQVVAVRVDTCYFAEFRTDSRKPGLMIATGLTATGRVIALATGMTWGESAEDYESLLLNIFDRGVSSRVMGIGDGSKGLAAAWRSVTHRDEPILQTCTTHAARAVCKNLPKDMNVEIRGKLEEEIRADLYAAWAESDADIARKKLQEVADNLRAAGHVKSSDSLIGSMEGTLTVQKLGIHGEPRIQLRTTNGQESVNSSLENNGLMTNVTNWRHGEQVLFKASLILLDLEQDTWVRLGDPEQLVNQLDRALPGHYDIEALRATLPPHLSVKKLSVNFDDELRTRAIASRWCADHPDGTVFGSKEAVKALGLTDKKLTPSDLYYAMRCQDPVTGKYLRRPERIKVLTENAEGEQVETTAPGIIGSRWRLVASPAEMEQWRKGGEAREKVEARFVKAAEAAIERETLTTSIPSHGFAGVAALQRPTPDSPENRLAVVGINFAVQRGEGAKLGSAGTDDMFTRRVLRAAEDRAKAVLDGKPREVAPPEPVAEPSHPAARPAPEPTPVSPELIEAVKARALVLAPRMIGAEAGELQERAARLAEAGASLRSVAGEVRDWRAKNWDAAAMQLAAAGRSTKVEPLQKIRERLTRGRQAVLGEMQTQSLLGDAAKQFGIARTDPEEASKTAHEAAAKTSDPLAGLEGPVARVRAAAIALAAGIELKRRQQFEAARQGDGRTATSPALRDGRGEFFTDPINRYRDALGPERQAVLVGYAREVLPELRQMEDGAVRRLAAETSGAWTDLERNSGAGVRLNGLEKSRAATLDEGMRAMQAVGEEQGRSQVAERAHNVSVIAAAAADAEVAERRAARCWKKLGTLGQKIRACRGEVGSPATLVENHPDAAISSAAHVELIRREREAATPAREAVTRVAEPPARVAEGTGYGL
jgi:mutator family transposase